MRVLITGGAGVIGSHLAEACLNRAHEVWVLDALSTGIVMIPYADAYEEGFEDMPRRVPSVDRVHAVTGFIPTPGIDEIIESVIDAITAETDAPSALHAPTTA